MKLTKEVTTAEKITKTMTMKRRTCIKVKITVASPLMGPLFWLKLVNIHLTKHLLFNIKITTMNKTENAPRNN